jgi:hypothetical protein
LNGTVSVKPKLKILQKIGLSSFTHHQSNENKKKSTHKEKGKLKQIKISLGTRKITHSFITVNHATKLSLYIFFPVKVNHIYDETPPALRLFLSFANFLPFASCVPPCGSVVVAASL